MDIQKLEKLKELKDKGALTQEEFDEQMSIYLGAGEEKNSKNNKNIDKKGQNKKINPQKINKIHRVALSGGLIGCIFTNPREALESAIREHNEEGWRCVQIIPHSTTNFFIKIIQILCLILTLFLWTFGAGYLVLLEKDYE